MKILALLAAIFGGAMLILAGINDWGTWIMRGDWIGDVTVIGLGIFIILFAVAFYVQ